MTSTTGRTPSAAMALLVALAVGTAVTHSLAAAIIGLDGEPDPDWNGNAMQLWFRADQGAEEAAGDLAENLDGVQYWRDQSNPTSYDTQMQGVSLNDHWVNGGDPVGEAAACSARGGSRRYRSTVVTGSSVPCPPTHPHTHTLVCGPRPRECHRLRNTEEKNDGADYNRDDDIAGYARRVLRTTVVADSRRRHVGDGVYPLEAPLGQSRWPDRRDVLGRRRPHLVGAEHLPGRHARQGPAEPFRRNVGLWISTDKGASWSPPLHLDVDTEDAGYGDLRMRRNGDLVVVSYHGSFGEAAVKQYVVRMSMDA